MSRIISKTANTSWNGFHHTFVRNVVKFQFSTGVLITFLARGQLILAGGKNLFEHSYFSPVKMCRQPAIWPPTTKYLPLTSHLSDLYSGQGCFELLFIIAGTNKMASKWFVAASASDAYCYSQLAYCSKHILTGLRCQIK